MYHVLFSLCHVNLYILMIIIILIRDNLIYDIIYTGFVSEVRDLRIVNNIEASSLYCDSVIVVLL